MSQITALVSFIDIWNFTNGENTCPSQLWPGKSPLYLSTLWRCRGSVGKLCQKWVNEPIPVYVPVPMVCVVASCTWKVYNGLRILCKATTHTFPFCTLSKPFFCHKMHSKLVPVLLRVS